MSESNVIVRRMSTADLPGARRLQMQEGWNQVEQDWRFFLESNPEGCFVASDGGEVVGTITSIRFGTEVAWLSLLMVDNRVRGQGVGGRLMARAIEANERVCATLRLDATQAGRPVYGRLGFEDVYGLARWIAPEPPALAKGDGDCEPLTRAELAMLLHRDREVFGADRSGLLDRLVGEAPGGAWLLRRRGKVAGYMLGRDGDRYDQLGPLVAERPVDAATLLRAGLRALRRSDRTRRPVIVDVPSARRDFGRFLASVGFQLQRPLTRMSRGAPVRERPRAVSAIAGPEFG